MAAEPKHKDRLEQAHANNRPRATLQRLALILRLHREALTWLNGVA